MSPEIMLVNKPKGLTSFDVIRIFRKKLNIRKIGHAGTLDPMATGLMILGVGNGTKKLSQLLKLDKEYEAEILIGLSTDTFDMDGKILEESTIDHLEEEIVKKKLEQLKGTHEYEVPRFSAVKVKGKKLYDLARKGVQFQPPTRKMTVHDVEFLGLEKKDKFFIVKARFRVASGTYIRTLAVEFGKLLQTPSTLYSIKRTKIGNFKIEDSVDI